MPVLLSLVFLSLVGFGVVIPLLPFYAALFDAPAWQITLMFATFSAGQFLGELTWGRLSDRIGRRPVLLVTMAASAVGYVALAFAPGIWIAILIRGAMGFFSGNVSAIQGYIIDISPRERVAGRLGLFGSAFSIGFVAGPVLGGLFAGQTSILWISGWRWVFLVNVPVVALALVATWLIRPANDPDPSKRWDAVSSILVMIGLVGTVVAIKEIGHAPPSVATIVVALLVAAIGFWLFVRRQRRLENPLLEFSIFLNPAFSAGVLAAAFAMFAIGGIQLVTTQRFQQVVGFSPLEAGLLVAVIAVGSLPTGLLGGAFLHRVGLLALITGGLAVATGGVVVTVIGFQSSFGVLILGLLLTGAGIGAALAVASASSVSSTVQSGSSTLPISWLSQKIVVTPSSSAPSA